MSEFTESAPEMRLFSPEGHRLYLTAEERASFLSAASREEPVERMFFMYSIIPGADPPKLYN